MRFAYMDEAGNTGRKLDEPHQPIHLILSLVIDETKITAVHEHVRAVGRRHCPGTCDQSKFEFHGADLFAARGPFAGMTPERRIEIFDDVLQAIEIAEGDVIIRGVEKAGLERRYTTPYHPHDIALMFRASSRSRGWRATAGVESCSWQTRPKRSRTLHFETSRTTRSSARPGDGTRSRSTRS